MGHAQRRLMKTRLMWLGLGLGLVLAPLGCQVTVNDGDDDCSLAMPVGDECGRDFVCVDGSWVLEEGQSFCTPCPEYQPSDGEACSAIGQTCQYEEEFGCDTEISFVTSRCTEDGWFTAYPNCQPEPVCPDDMPIAGSDCSDWDFAYWCDYPTNCGDGSSVSMHCEITVEASTWVIDSEPSCQLACADASGTAECAAIAGCQWLEPGCAEPPQTAISAGCYPIDDCTVNACTPDEVCSPYVYNPCFDQPCDACGGEYSLCTPVKLD